MKKILTIAPVITMLALPVNGEETLQEQIDALRDEVEILRALVLELHQTNQGNSPEAVSSEGAEISVPTLDDIFNSILDGVVGVEQQILVVDSWSISETEISHGSAFEITVSLENQGIQEIIMLDAVIRFNDRLGTYIASIEIPKDLAIPSGQSVTFENQYFGWELDRLIRLDPDFVDVVLKVDNVVFADGTTLVATD